MALEPLGWPTVDDDKLGMPEAAALLPELAPLAAIEELDSTWSGLGISLISLDAELAAPGNADDEETGAMGSGGGIGSTTPVGACSTSPRHVHVHVQPHPRPLAA